MDPGLQASTRSMTTRASAMRGSLKPLMRVVLSAADSCDQHGTTRGAAMGWAKSKGEIFYLFNFPVTVKIRTSGYQTLDCFIATLPT